MVWKPFFVHEFLDSRIDNVNAAPGRVVHSSPAPAVRSGVLLRRGRWFGYDFAEPVDGVIGVDVKMMIHAPAVAGSDLAVISVGDVADVHVVFNNPSKSVMVDGHRHVLASVVVAVGAEIVIVEDFPIPHRFAIPMRVGWHNSGQLKIQVGSSLVAYEPSVAAGARFTISKLRVGDDAGVAAPSHRFFIQGISVRLLLEDDAVAEVLRMFPIPPEMAPDDERCVRLALDHQRAVLERIRELMRAFTDSTTQSWRLSIASPSPKFDPAAGALHDASNSALITFASWLDDRDEAAQTEYLVSIEKVCVLLHSRVPGAYESTLAAIELLEPPPQRCRDLVVTHTTAHSDLVAELIDISERTLAIMKKVGGN